MEKTYDKKYLKITGLHGIQPNHDSLMKPLSDFKKLSESDQLQNRHYHTLDCRTYTSSVCDLQYFAELNLLDEIEKFSIVN